MKIGPNLNNFTCSKYAFHIMCTKYIIIHSQFYIYKNLQLKSNCYISIPVLNFSCILLIEEVQEKLVKEHELFL